MSKRSLVSVVDDSESVRESLPDLLRYSGYDVQTFESAEAFLASETVSDTSCLILDVGLPGMSGPDLQQELIRTGHEIPIVFITAQGDYSIRPRLVARGAVACLFKPFSDTALLEALEAALRIRQSWDWGRDHGGCHGRRLHRRRRHFGARIVGAAGSECGLAV